MARTRSGQDLIDDAYGRADLIGTEDRHPRDKVLRYVNEGATELYDLLVEARGRTYFRATPPWSIATQANVTRYALPPTFYQLISVRVAGASGFTLDTFDPQDEPALRDPGGTVVKPCRYELQPGFIELLPIHQAGTTVIVDYVPVFVDLTDTTTSTFDGINGWEQYIVYYAAREMLFKDGEKDDAAAQTAEMAALAKRIGKLAPQRDRFRAERVKNVRARAFTVNGRRW